MREIRDKKLPKKVVNLGNILHLTLFKQDILPKLVKLIFFFSRITYALNESTYKYYMGEIRR